MKIIRKDAVIFGECDSFEDVCKHINDLYEIVREQRETIEFLILGQETIKEALKTKANANHKHAVKKPIVKKNKKK